VGDYPDEFEALHVPYQQRGKLTDEYLDILQKIFSDGELSYQGDYISCGAAFFYPRVDPPPIFIGGGVFADPTGDRLLPAVLRRVARVAHGWMPDWGSPDLFRPGHG
jgi:alkanesulfonate monooxygenase SsuD/methylene tetrahydromethanopterin reductase-like flavin-dependent oxidoreductase (luciferase family)